MTAGSRIPGFGSEPARRPQYRRRFGLSSDAVRPIFGDVARSHPALVPAPAGGSPAPMPRELAVYQPGLSAPKRFVARLGTSGTVRIGLRPKPVSTKGLIAVSGGAVVGMMVAQPLDAVTFLAPLYGLVLGLGGGAVGWRAIRGRGAVTIEIDAWRPQLDAIDRILQNADLIGQPFASPPALRVALHSALWHAVNAVGQPGDADVLAAFDHQLEALRRATENALVELESPSIDARKAAVSERLADAVSEIELLTGPHRHEIATCDDTIP
jgi:hypothetical protein